MSRVKEDEDYWNTSKCKAFTFDDHDEDGLSQLKESKRAVNSLKAFVEEDDEDWERFTWSGEPVGSISWSIKETSSSSRGLDTRTPGTEKSRPEPSSYLPKPVSSYSIGSLFKGKSRQSSFQSLSDVFQDYNGEWSVEDTVRRMSRGKVCSLERFRSLKDKLQLLDEAVRLHDGNVITAVSRRRVSSAFYRGRSVLTSLSLFGAEILFREVKERPETLRHFIHFLKETEEQQLLLELLSGRRLPHLCLFLRSLPFSPDDAAHVQDHYTLLERQIIIEVNDKHLEASGQEIFRRHPRKASLLFMPLVTTLFYSCIYHYTEAQGTFSSPSNLRKTFKVPEKLYILTALAARAKLRAWNDVDALFTSKNWLGYTKKKAPIGFHRVVEILHKNGAPVQILQEYTRLVEDVETRISLGTKYKCHHVVIDTYRDLKDRQQLMVYRCKVDRGSLEEDKIDQILGNTTYRDLKDRQQLMVYRCKVDRGSPEEDKIDQILGNTEVAPPPGDVCSVRCQGDVAAVAMEAA
ncbi:PREDICTED: spermatogenesis-defective protein 39 homolog [Nanorana parkeri]|uniref:spermatogenesis-defective protein 39 homolog n=1 Tax=Nanorana parkeri TaxID=125878 RepID=UPI00085427E8|nr:PREDICTED: spermatogenesis-defective protein 39 homolog [Nanorana parkeri]